MSPFPPSRVVACLVALASLAALVPVGAAEDQCTSNDPLRRACVGAPLNAPSGLPSPLYGPADLVFGRYYVYVGTADCLASAISNSCRGVEAGAGSTLGVFGIVHEESNGVDGLQRQKFVFGGRLVLADRMVVL